MFRSVRILFILLVFSLLMVACSSPTGDGSVEDAASSASTSSESEASQFDGTILIGAALSETGSFAREGKFTQRGYDVWVDWVNNEYGGIRIGDKRYRAEIIYYDDESDPDTSANLVEKLITDDGVQFLLGPYSSGLTLPTSAIAEKHGVLMVEANGASEALFERGFKNIFAVLTPAGNYTESGLRAFADMGAKTVVIAYEDTAFPTAVAQGAERWAREYGLEVLAVESYPRDISDVSSIMSKFRDLNPDVFVGGGHFNDALLFVRSAQENGFSPQAMLLTVGPDSPEFVSELGSAANFVYGPAQWDRTMSYSDEYFGTAEDYANRYIEMWGEAPPYQSASSTAAALVLHLAIERAGSMDTDAVRQALYDMDMETFYGRIRFDETGKNVAKPMATIQIQDGQINVVAPTDAAIADLLFPMPSWEARQP